jgi:hypothetical protein
MQLPFVFVSLLKLTAGEAQLRQQARREGAPQLRLGQLRREVLPLLQHALQHVLHTQ